MLLIGAKIQEYRKKAGLSQEEFAAKIGVTRQAVSKWELDKTYPDLDKLVGICDVFGISITEFIYGRLDFTPKEHAEGENMTMSAGENMTASKGENMMMSAEENMTPPAGEGLATAAGEAADGNRTAEPEDKGSSLISAGRARGRGARVRLSILFVLLGALFLFCGVMLVTTLLHSPRRKDDGFIEKARVERVYQQYTKADLGFYDDSSRKVVQTVWLDIDGIREGDYIECYTDGGQRNVYYEYHARTPVVLAAVTGGFLILFLLCAAELRRLFKENRWHVLLDEAGEQV